MRQFTKNATRNPQLSLKITFYPIMSSYGTFLFLVILSKAKDLFTSTFMSSDPSSLRSSG